MAEHQSGATGSMETVFESTLESVDAAEALGSGIATGIRFPEEDLHKIGMAVSEAMVNAVVHGNRYNLKKKVHFSLSSAAIGLAVTIVDEGEGFEPSELAGSVVGGKSAAAVRPGTAVDKGVCRRIRDAEGSAARNGSTFGLSPQRRKLMKAGG